MRKKQRERSGQKQLPDDEVLSIVRLIPGGAGMAHRQQGTTVFVPGAFVGDQIKVTRSLRKKKLEFVEDFHLIEGSKERVQPACAIADSCGGCDWMKISAAAQRAGKISILEQSLRRTGGLNLAEEEIQWIGSPHALAYRERIRLKVRAGRLGFFAATSHELVEVKKCLVAQPELNQILELLQQLLAEHPLVLEGVDSLELRVLPPANNQPVRVLIHLSTIRGSDGKHIHKKLKELRAALEGKAFVAVNDEEQPWQVVKLADTYSFTQAGAFSQINPAVNELMLTQVLELAQQSGAQTFLDLYCGNGNFSLPLLKRGLSGVGVELNASAIAAAVKAQEQFADETWGAGQFLALSSEQGAQQLLQEGRSFDLVIVDPPRAGAKELTTLLSKLCSKTLIMIACDPVTLARDLKILLADGFELQSVTALDMFPQTHHVESLALLRRN